MTEQLFTKTTYERQLLIELQTKQDAVQVRLDWYLTECYRENDIPKDLIAEYYRLGDRIAELEKGQ